MTRISRTIVLSALVAAPFHAQADDRNGFFPTDILAVGNSYTTFSASTYSEKSGESFQNVPGRFEKQWTKESATIRHGLISNVDVTLTLPYYSQYKSTQSYANGAFAASNRLEGMGNPVLSVSYGLLNSKDNPFSVKATLAASPNSSGKLSGFVEPSLSLGYKFNETMRAYAVARLINQTNENYAGEQGVKVGGQYDLSSSFTLDATAGVASLNSAGGFRSYDVKTIGVEGIYKVSANLFVAPSVTLNWRSAVVSNDGVKRFDPSTTRTFEILVKHLF